MQQLAAFPDAEKVVMAMLADVTPTVVTSVPNPLPGPTIRVNRVGGADDFVTDYPRIEVMLLYPVSQAGDTDLAWAMAEQCRQTILASRNTTVGGALVDNAVTVTPAQQLPWDNQNVRRIVATYQLSFRRPRV